MLLEILSDFQISIPELGTIEATTHPIVLLTSNNTRELTEALKRRCLYLWLDYPSLEHELEIVRLHAPDLPEQVAAKLVELVAMVRDLDLKKPPSIAESIDWARALLLLGAEDIDEKMFRDTMSVIVKHRTDLDVVAERVGVKLGLPPRAPRYGVLDERLLEFGEELAVGGGRGRDQRAARRVRRAAGDPVDRPGRLPRGAGRDAGEVPGGPPHLRAGLRPLLLPRHRAGGDPRGRHGGRRRRRRRRRARPRGAAPADRPGAAPTATRARCATSRGWPSPRSAARARARASSASTSSASAARWPARRAPARAAARGPARATGCRARRSAASRRCCAASSSARRSSAPSSCRRRGRSTSSTAPCRRARCRTSPRSTASSPSSSAA